MLVENTLVTLEKKEIKNLSIDNVKFDASLVSHIRRIDRIQKALEAEIKAYKEIAKKMDLSENKLVTVENKPSNKFDKDRFIEEYGQAEYDRFCSLHDAWYVTFNG